MTVSNSYEYNLLTPTSIHDEIVEKLKENGVSETKMIVFNRVNPDDTKQLKNINRLTEKEIIVVMSTDFEDKLEKMDMAFRSKFQTLSTNDKHADKLISHIAQQIQEN